MALKAWKDLTITDDYMFKLVMEHRHLCKHLIECVLNIKIRRIRYLEKEKTVKNSYLGKGIRLDVYVEDEQNSRFLLEMQARSYDDRSLGRRSRYYQSSIDFDFLHMGEPYINLGNAYVIFFCPFKLFDGQRRMYTYESICREDGRLTLDDGVKKIFLSSKGDKTDVIHKDLAAMLDYMDGKLDKSNGFAQRLDSQIKEDKANKEKEADYMTFQMKIWEEREEARAEGVAQGMTQGMARGMAEQRERTAVKLLHRLAGKGIAANKTSLAEIAEDSDLSISRVMELAKQCNVAMI